LKNRYCSFRLGTTCRYSINIYVIVLSVFSVYWSLTLVRDVNCFWIRVAKVIPVISSLWHLFGSTTFLHEISEI